MKHTIWRKTIWAALLTAAFLTGATGCGEKINEADTSSAASDSSAVDVIQNNDESAEVTAKDGAYSYEMNADGTITLTGYQGEEKELNVPATIDSYVVSAIGNHAFEANWDITSVTLPNGLSVIGEGAFMDCGSLTTVHIPETVSVVQRAAFAGCSSLASVVLPETVSEVMEEAFTGCGSLTSLTVANSALEYHAWGLIEGAEPLPVTISCASGSAIEAWAGANGIATQPIS